MTQKTIIIGAGLTGMTMACSLAANDIPVTVIEQADINDIRKKESDGRTSAISYGSVEIFKKIGLWDTMQDHAGAILDIHITDGNSPVFLHYDHKLVGSHPMGYIIENYHIRESLFKRAAELKNLTIISPAKYTSVERNQNNVRVTLENGEVLDAALLIAAEGRMSKIRKQAGIKTTGWTYDQHGIVCTVKHEKNHDGIAYERFLAAGPFAILPMQGGYHSSIVWTEKSELAPLFMAMDDVEFLEHLESRFGDFLGRLEVVGKRFCYPLALSHAARYSDTRLALIGDAAHGIHPIAGQGFNLGIRDVPVLTDLIVQQKNLGLDIGTASILSEYEKLRKYDSTSLIAITDILNRLFSNNIFPLKIARQIGLGAIEKLPGVKKFFMRHAMGIVN